MDLNTSYLMMKPPFGEQVFDKKRQDEEHYSPNKQQIAQDILRRNDLVAYIGILTFFTPEQIAEMYPLYVNQATFEHLCNFYARNLSLVYLVHDKRKENITTQKILALKKDYALASGTDYRASLGKLRLIPGEGKQTPNLPLLAQKIKNGENIFNSRGEAVTYNLVKTLYGSGAKVHSPSTPEENTRDLEAILGIHYSWVENKLDSYVEDHPYATGCSTYYWSNPRSGAFMNIEDMAPKFFTTKFSNPYLYHRVLQQPDQLESLGLA